MAYRDQPNCDMQEDRDKMTVSKSSAPNDLLLRPRSFCEIHISPQRDRHLYRNPPFVDVVDLELDALRGVVILLDQAVAEQYHCVDLLIVRIDRRDERLVPLDQVLSAL